MSGGAVQVEDADGRVVHCVVDSMDLGLLIGVHFKIRDRNVVSNKYQHSSLVPPSPVQPEGLVASDGKSVVGVQVCLWDAGHISMFFM